MTDLSTSNLKRLLDQATPGPWEARDNYTGLTYHIRDAEGDYLGIMHGPDAHLAALAPPLAQEVLRMRRELKSVQDAWLLMYADPERTPTEQDFAKHVVDHIDTVLGDRDE